MWAVGYYSCFVWMGYYLSEYGGEQGKSMSWTINFIMNLILVLAFPVSGHLGDMMGKQLGNEDEGFRRIMQIGSGSLFLLAIPAFAIIQSKSVAAVIIGEMIFLICLSLFGSNLPGKIHFLGLCSLLIHTNFYFQRLWLRSFRKSSDAQE